MVGVDLPETTVLLVNKMERQAERVSGIQGRYDARRPVNSAAGGRCEKDTKTGEHVEVLPVTVLSA